MSASQGGLRKRGAGNVDSATRVSMEENYVDEEGNLISVSWNMVVSNELGTLRTGELSDRDVVLIAYRALLNHCYDIDMMKSVTGGDNGTTHARAETLEEDTVFTRFPKLISASYSLQDDATMGHHAHAVLGLSLIHI